MKTTLHYLLFVFFISTISLAQEAGKKGKLMPNEISTNKNTRGRNKNNPQTSRGGMNPNYNWNYNYNMGYSEIFLRIPQNGFYTVRIDDQTIANDNGRYRFFDLNTGSHTMTITMGRNLIYRTRLSTPNNTRMVLDFFMYEGLYLLDTIPLGYSGMNNNNYGNIWNSYWNDIYNNSNNGNNYGWNPNVNYGNNGNNGNYGNNGNNGNNGNIWNGNNGNNGNYVNTFDFEQFYKVVQNQAFNSSKIEIIKGQNNNAKWRSDEIKRLLQLFAFDNDKLDVAKLCYANCIDKQNYFNLYTSFAFEKSITELNRFVNTGGRN